MHIIIFSRSSVLVVGVRNEFIEMQERKKNAAADFNIKALQKIQINNIFSFKWFTVLFTALASHTTANALALHVDEAS